MFDRLQKKWKVKKTQLLLILCVFAITGTATAWMMRQITTWIHLDSSSPWFWILKVGVLIFGYQVLILLFSLPFGQFPFFWKYEKKILRRFGLMSRQNTETGKEPKTSMQKIAIFASGTGTNAQKIIDHFRNSSRIKIALIACNKPGAGVLTIAEKENIPTLIIQKEKFYQNGYLDELKEKEISFIVLAGFLWKIPAQLIRAYRHRIINIHPALLPKYGGKGFYGQRVHESVLTAGEVKSGITIHYVDEHYDNGDIILQVSCPVLENDTSESLATRIHALEHLHYPRTIEKLILSEEYQ